MRCTSEPLTGSTYCGDSEGVIDGAEVRTGPFAGADSACGAVSEKLTGPCGAVAGEFPGVLTTMLRLTAGLAASTAFVVLGEPLPKGSFWKPTMVGLMLSSA